MALRAVNWTDILVLEMLQELQFSVSPFAENGGAEGLHDLLYRHGCPCKLILGRAVAGDSSLSHEKATEKVQHTKPARKHLERN